MALLNEELKKKKAEVGMGWDVLRLQISPKKFFKSSARGNFECNIAGEAYEVLKTT